MEHSEHSQPTAFQQLKDISLRASGYGFLLGDAALFAAGWREGNPKVSVAGAAWTLGGLAAAYGGNPSQEKQLALLCRRLRRHLHEKNIAIPNVPSTALLAQDGGVIAHIEDFLHAHPADVLNLFSIIGAGFFFRAGMKSGIKADMASAALIATGGLAGLLIQEKQPDPEYPPQGMIQHAVNWVEEKPLRVTGALQIANNAAMFIGANKQRDAHQGSHIYRFASAASYLFANIMLFMSSKHSDAATDSQLLQRMAEMSAQVIAAQPLALQEEVLHDIARYLAHKTDGLNEASFSAMLREELAAAGRHRTAHPHQRSRDGQSGTLPSASRG